jgi:hypothetical protein
MYISADKIKLDYFSRKGNYPPAILTGLALE